jgi:hypothetical protein
LRRFEGCDSSAIVSFVVKVRTFRKFLSLLVCERGSTSEEASIREIRPPLLALHHTGYIIRLAWRFGIQFYNKRDLRGHFDVLAMDHSLEAIMDTDLLRSHMKKDAPFTVPNTGRRGGGTHSDNHEEEETRFRQCNGPRGTGLTHGVGRIQHRGMALPNNL